MAETKTNIPFQVKMGAEKDSSGASKLPSFEEGSLIITTDTKKVYVDPIDSDERIAVGGTEVVVDSELSKTSENPVQNKVINSALNDKQDKFADLDYEWNSSGNSVNQLSLVLKNASKTTSTGGVVSLIPKLSLANETGQDIKLTGISAPAANNDAANKQYVDNNKVTVDTALSTTSTNPVQNKVVTQALNNRQEKITSETTLTFADGKIGIVRLPTGNGEVDLYASDSRILTIENGDLEDSIVRGVGTPSENNDAANKKYVDDSISTKQDYFASILKADDNWLVQTSPHYVTITNNSMSASIALTEDIDGNGEATLLGADTQLSLTKNNVTLSKNQSSAKVNLLGVATPISSADTLLGITADDLPYQAVNKKYVDDAISGSAIKQELLKNILDISFDDQHNYMFDIVFDQFLAVGGSTSFTFKGSNGCTITQKIAPTNIDSVGRITISIATNNESGTRGQIFCNGGIWTINCASGTNWTITLPTDNYYFYNGIKTEVGDPGEVL